MLLTDAQAHLEIMLEQRTPFEDIDAFIENVALPAEDAAALWLYAWAKASRRSRRDPQDGLLSSSA